LTRLPTWHATSLLIRLHPRSFVTFSLLYVVGFAATIVPGLLLQRIYDQLTRARPEMHVIWMLLALMAGVGIARTITDVVRTFSEEAFRCHGWSRLRGNVATNALLRPGAEDLGVTPGDAINRLESDVMELADWPSWLPYIVAQGVAAVAAFVVMLTVDVPLALLSVLPSLVAVVFVSKARSAMLRYAQRSREAVSAVTGFLGEALDGITAVKALTAEQNVVRHLMSLNRVRAQAEVRQSVLMAILEWANANVADLALGGLLLLASRGLRAGSFTIGDFALFAAYLPIIVQLPATLGGFLADYETQTISIERLLELQPNAPPGSLIAPLVRPWTDAPHRHSPAVARSDTLDVLTAVDLTYHYDSTASLWTGIDGVDLTIHRGELVVITGRVGSGKTTLLRVLLGLLAAQRGHLFWNGKEVEAPSSYLRPPRIAYVPQVPRLFSTTLRDNILLGHPAGNAALAHAVRRSVLDADLARLPKGLETLVGPRGMRLSGGQVQRAAAARALVRTPDLLVLDDISSALDVETEARLWERVSAPSGATCLVVSTRPYLLERADRILVMEAGQLEAVGNVRSLLATSPTFREIWARTTALQAPETTRRADG